MELISWLLVRLSLAYGLLSSIGIPPEVAGVLTVLLVVLFFYCLYDLFVHRNKGSTALFWLGFVLLVPFGTVIYLGAGRSAVRRAAIMQPLPPATTNASPAPVPFGDQQNNTASDQQQAYLEANRKKYFLGATTMLGSIIATIALLAGIIALAFFVMIVIAYIQCMNDPKCM